MNRMQQQVEEFHRALGQYIGTEPAIVHPELRVKLIREEAKETCDAIEEGDLVGAIDGVCDLIYVALGTAVEFGLDLEPIFDEVHRSNMAKKGGAVREDGKRLKPEGWTPPDVAGEINKQRTPIDSNAGAWMYSCNEENWSNSDSYPTRDEAEAAAREYIGMSNGERFWTGRRTRITPDEIAGAITNAEYQFEEDMSLWLYDNVGDDFADSYNLPKDSVADLRSTMLRAAEMWFRSHPECMPTCFKIEEVESHVMGDDE